MVHSFCELQEGCFFDVDPYGRPWMRDFSGPIMGGFKAVLCGIKGDQKHLQRALKLKTSWNSERVCMYCHATQSGRTIYTAFGPSAPHRSSLVSTEEFIESGCHPNPWVRLPGFHLELVLTDWLHLVDLSLTPEVAASESCLTVEQFNNCFAMLGRDIGLSCFFPEGAELLMFSWCNGCTWWVTACVQGLDRNDAEQSNVERGIAGRTFETGVCSIYSRVQATSHTLLGHVLEILDITTARNCKLPLFPT